MPQDNYSIVVLGKMNPAIHHPLWYQHLELVNDEEFNHALNSQNTLVIQSLAQIEFPDLTIKCQQDRWEINVKEQDNCERAVSVASKVFEALYHTQLSAFGFNVSRHLETSKENVADELATLVESSGLPLPENEGERDASLTYQIGTEARRRSIKYEASKNAKNQIFVHQNIHYDLEQQGITGYFNLRDLLEPRFVPDCDEAVHLAKKVASSI